MGWVFLLIALFFFFLAGVGSTIIPNPLAWGLACMALGLALGGDLAPYWRRP